MTHIKLEQRHVDDARWVDAGGDAFAVHIAALTWCDQQTSDGRIPIPMASRVSLAVEPAAALVAIDILLERGFWVLDGDAYVILDYDSYGLMSDEIKTTRERWAADQKRRRRHGNGDHSLCTDPKFCPAIRPGSNVSADTSQTLRGVSDESATYTRPSIPDHPYTTSREGMDGSGGAAVRAAEPSAGATGSGASRGSTDDDWAAAEARVDEVERAMLQALTASEAWSICAKDQDDDDIGDYWEGVANRNQHAYDPDAEGACSKMVELKTSSWREFKQCGASDRHIVHVSRMHAFVDDGTGQSCERCGMPQGHAFHRSAA